MIIVNQGEIQIIFKIMLSLTLLLPINNCKHFLNFMKMNNVKVVEVR